MAKILILFKGQSFNKVIFCQQLQENLPADVTIDAVDFENVALSFRTGETKVFIGKTNIDDYDVVYFRRAGGQFMWLAGTIALYLDFKGKKYVDTVHRGIGPGGSKLAAFVKMANAGLPIIPSYYCHRSLVNAKAEVIINQLGLPLVAKEISSHRGEGVVLVNSKQDLAEVIIRRPDKNFIFQQYVPTQEEYRVLVLGETIGAFEKKTPTVKGEFRGNVALGAKEEFYEPDSIPDDYKAICLKAARVVGIQIAGVDLLVDNSDKPWVLEVNRGPGFTYDDPASPEIKNLANYFVQLLEIKAK